MNVESCYRSNFFFYELTMKNWAMHMHFNPLPILLGLFLKGGAKGPPPWQYIDSEPWVYRVKHK